jgi:hypothetical protein
LQLFTFFHLREFRIVYICNVMYVFVMSFVVAPCRENVHLPISWNSSELHGECRLKRYFERFKLIVECIKQIYDDATFVVFPNGQKLVVDDVLKMTFLKKYHLENITMYQVITQNGIVLAEDVGTVSARSDADVTCTMRTRTDVDRFRKIIRKKQETVSLSWVYDLNFYMTTTKLVDPCYGNNDLDTCKMFLRAKLYRHGIIDTFETSDAFDPKPYRTYTEAEIRTRKNTTVENYESLRSAEMQLYDRMCDMREKYIDATRPIDQSYYEFFKIEGYVLASTLRVHLTLDNGGKFSQTDLLAAFMENLVDGAIHMTNNTAYKKTKYLKRLCAALKALRQLVCRNPSEKSKESFEKRITENINEAQELHTLSRLFDEKPILDDLKQRASALVCDVVRTVWCVLDKDVVRDSIFVCSDVDMIRELAIQILEKGVEINACNMQEKQQKAS